MEKSTALKIPHVQAKFLYDTVLSIGVDTTDLNLFSHKKINTTDSGRCTTMSEVKIRVNMNICMAFYFQQDMLNLHNDSQVVFVYRDQVTCLRKAKNDKNKLSC